LERLQGQTHVVVTGLCLLHLRSHRQRIAAESTAVTFRKLDAVKIRRYLTQVNPLDKAGAYAIQEHGDQIIERVSGSYSNVVGLPMERLTAELHAWVAGVDAWKSVSLLAASNPAAVPSRFSGPSQFLP